MQAPAPSASWATSEQDHCRSVRSMPPASVRRRRPSALRNRSNTVASTPSLAHTRCAWAPIAPVIPNPAGTESVRQFRTVRPSTRPCRQTGSHTCGSISTRRRRNCRSEPQSDRSKSRPSTAIRRPFSTRKRCRSRSRSTRIRQSVGSPRRSVAGRRFLWPCWAAGRRCGIQRWRCVNGRSGR